MLENGQFECQCKAPFKGALCDGNVVFSIALFLLELKG